MEIGLGLESKIIWTMCVFGSNVDSRRKEAALNTGMKWL